jgi:predicted nuclease of restriction endonuclease-like (RecB) superfamily
MRVQDGNARHYYLTEAAQEGWSVRALERNITSHYYQRMLAAPGGEEKCNVALHNSNDADTATLDVKSFVKDPYVLEFVGLPPYPDHKEIQLEAALADNMQQFLLELGKGFSFVGRQYRISTETSHFYIDLVFYNYILKCFVLIDLKAKKLTHRDIGQMDMYVRMFDDLKRGEGDNPTIGILLCAEKEETVVKYSVLNGSQQLFAAKYLPYMPTEEELRNMIENNVRLIESGKVEGK